ncbi:MAG: isoprenylcysteine carboxylmethyltransferase family protein [Candidatus Thorarchaeota archaeon]|nr:isoprenylcysteine carboxylmethyltransferase family protein [Candidatus Thorarchaeota archaeon]
MEPELAFRIAFLVFYILLIVIRVYYTKKTPFARKSRKERFEDIRREGLPSAIVFLGMFWVQMIVALFYVLDVQLISWAYFILPLEIRMLGVILGTISVLSVFWVHQTLSGSFSATLEVYEDHQLVTSGPFARVRHPLYSAHTLFNAGMVLISANWILLLFLIIGIPFTYWRLSKEEEMLIEQFGDKYREYIKRTGRLFPKLRQTNSSD